MNTMKRNQLLDLDIDEVSTVDRPANQHGLIAFAKALQEEDMPQGQDIDQVFDNEGAPVELSDLEHGDVVYGEDGTEYVWQTDELEDERELESAGAVGKSAMGVARGFGRGVGGRAGVAAGAREQQGVEAGAHLRRNRKRYAGGAALGAGGAAAGYGVTKSLGDTVLEELAKAASQGERDEIVKAAFDEIEVLKANANEAWTALDEERDARLELEFISKADDYNLPVTAEVFGPVLKRLVENMDEADLEVLDTVFKSAGAMLYDEVGFVGAAANNSVLDHVDGIVAEMVSKSGGQFSTAEAAVALFEANPDAYDAYLQES